jgi:hypothetical protein
MVLSGFTVVEGIGPRNRLLPSLDERQAAIQAEDRL